MKTAMKAEEKAAGPASARRRSRGARVVYTQAPLQMATVVGRSGESWLVRLGAQTRSVAADPCIDPLLLEDAARTGARVVVDAAGGEPVIAGLLMTQRALTVDRDGVLDTKVRALRIAADDEITLKTSRSFVRMRGEELETYAHSIVTRARGVLKLLGVCIKLN